MSSVSDSTKSATNEPIVHKLRIFFDADALIAGSAPQSKKSASFILLQLSELTLIEGVYSSYVQEQAERNLKAKIPDALKTFEGILSTALTKVSDATRHNLEAFEKQAHKTDVPVLAAAVLSKSHYLVTFNVKHFPKASEQIRVVQPGHLLRLLRENLAKLPL